MKIMQVLDFAAQVDALKTVTMDHETALNFLIEIVDSRYALCDAAPVPRTDNRVGEYKGMTIYLGRKGTGLMIQFTQKDTR